MGRQPTLPRFVLLNFYCGQTQFPLQPLLYMEHWSIARCANYAMYRSHGVYVDVPMLHSPVNLHSACSNSKTEHPGAKIKACVLTVRSYVNLLSHGRFSVQSGERCK